MPQIFSSERLRQQEGVRAQRKEILRELFADFRYLLVNTGKTTKAEALIGLIASITGEELDSQRAIIAPSSAPEASSTSAAEVAQTKVLALQQSAGQILSPADLKAGSDVNAFIHTELGFNQEHKLSRHYDQLSTEQFFMLRQQLLKQYCFPESGEVRIRWNMATYLVNGRDHTFDDVVEIVSQPLPVELLDKHLMAAWKNGLILSSNLHFGAFEALVAHDHLLSVAYLPQELAKLGFVLADFASHDAGPAMINAIFHSIIANMPLYVE